MQIARAIEVLLAEPGTRAAAQRACRLLLVDEFQDLAPAHLLLVRLLAAPELAVFGVGDDDQTIYGFSGATPQWLIDYAALFPAAGDHPLEVDYRCPTTVVDAARVLLARNTRRVPKEIRAAPGRQAAASDLTVVATEDTVRATTDAVTGVLPPPAVIRRVMPSTFTLWQRLDSVALWMTETATGTRVQAHVPPRLAAYLTDFVEV